MSGVTHALQVSNLCVSRGSKAVLHNISFTVSPGRILALLGPNGAGKSSLVLALAGVLPASAGTVRLHERSLAGKKPDVVRAQGLVVVPEGHMVLGDLSVADNLHVGATHLPAAAAKRAFDLALEVFPELKDRLQQPAGMLSGGQKQMVCMAQALMAEPKVLVIDELSLGLAPVVVQRLTKVITELAQMGVGIVLIEQFTQLALAVAQDAVVLSRGHIAFSGTTQQLKVQPEILRSSYLAA